MAEALPDRLAWQTAMTVEGFSALAMKPYIVAAIRAALDEAAKVAWEYARGLRTAEPGVGSKQVGDHIAAAIKALKEAPSGP